MKLATVRGRTMKPARRTSPSARIRPRRTDRMTFDDRVRSRSAVVAVIGLGYVGLPLALAHVSTGFRVVGVDLDRRKVAALKAGGSPIRDVPSGEVSHAVRAGRLSAHTSYAPVAEADAIFVCVPTPYTRNKEPDTSCIASAARGIARYLKKGQIVILRSTSYPGTTEELMRPILERSGLRVGRDFSLAFAPERVDPGRKDYTIRNTPVVVGGCDPESTRRGALMLGQVTSQVVQVSSPAAAEMTKLLENVFRNVNIALVNQVAILCDRMGLNVWEIVDAASTKPYGFQVFHPGPGIGGHCIPVDPYYLAWKAREYDFHMDFIELAARVNDEMPYYVATRIFLSLNGRGAPPSAPSIFVLGAAFKRDIDDSRDSPALKIMELLRRRGAKVTYHDPFVPSVPFNGKALQSQSLDAATLREADCVVIAVDHSSFDYAWIVRHARRVFDTRNATRKVTAGREKITRL